MIFRKCCSSILSDMALYAVATPLSALRPPNAIEHPGAWSPLAAARPEDCRWVGSLGPNGSPNGFGSRTAPGQDTDWSVLGDEHWVFSPREASQTQLNQNIKCESSVCEHWLVFRKSSNCMRYSEILLPLTPFQDLTLPTPAPPLHLQHQQRAVEHWHIRRGPQGFHLRRSRGRHLCHDKGSSG